MNAVALACDWEGDWQAEIADLLWLILSPIEDLLQQSCG